jgi:hypothetical protein
MQKPPVANPPRPESSEEERRHFFVRWVSKIFPVAHFVISLMFVAGALGLILLAGFQLWDSLWASSSASFQNRVNTVLESIAILTVALAALELGQTILEEEVQRGAQMSAPTRVRRFLSRFMIVLVVALAIESLVLVFRAGHEHLEQLPYVTSVGFMAAALLAAWGVFVWLNRSVEELEPEAMAEVKREDEQVKQ